MRKVLIAILILSLLLLSGCGAIQIKRINDNPDYFLGKKVTVQGTVVNPVKLGTLSGFTLKDDSGSIIISSEDVPSDKAEVTVKGTVVKGLMMQQYIYADKITIE